MRRDMWPVGHVKFKLDTESAAAAGSHPVPVGDQATRYRRAFLSYGSEDRPKVIDRVQMLRLMDIEYFQDLLALEPGERWERRLYEGSNAATCSSCFGRDWLAHPSGSRRETQHALEHKVGDEYASPEICPGARRGSPRRGRELPLLVTASRAAPVGGRAWRQPWLARSSGWAGGGEWRAVCSGQRGWL